MAQQAKPNNMYHCEEARPQLSSSSTLVVKTVSGSWLINGVKTSGDDYQRQPSTIVDPALGVLHGKVIGLGFTSECFVEPVMAQRRRVGASVGRFALQNIAWNPTAALRRLKRLTANEIVLIGDRMHHLP
jgi:hypothetical protein